MSPRTGTTVEATVERVVDGDTVQVRLGGRSERLRLSNLDTEESNHGSDKPVTPWGKKAKENATALLPAGSTVMLEFAGHESVEICLKRYRDNFGRLLVWLYRGDDDFQESTIRAGFSPYFTKYGYADFPDHHARYGAAERDAQCAHLGVWDQVTVNGSEQRNYALLGMWWTARAELIDGFRRLKEVRPDLLNTRLDHHRLAELAAQQQTATVFTELREFTRLSPGRGMVDVGSKAQPFKVFLPDTDGEPGQRILRLLDNRYLPKEPNHVRRGYAYVRGPLKLFQGEPEIVVTSADQITDSP